MRRSTAQSMGQLTQPSTGRSILPDRPHNDPAVAIARTPMDYPDAMPADLAPDAIEPVARPPLTTEDLEPPTDLSLQLPDPEDDKISFSDFQIQIDNAWRVCDRFDLQTDIWRGRILRIVRDREKRSGDGRGTGFLNWLKDREISKSQAYSLIELADSADRLMDQDALEPETLRHFSKRAFVATAKAPAEVQHMVVAAAHQGDRIATNTVRRLTDEWQAATSELLPENIRIKAAEHSLPARYLAPLVREMEKLPEVHQVALREEIEDQPDKETVKQATAQAKFLARYLDAATRVAALDRPELDLEQALEEALRLGSLNLAADLVNQAAQLEQAIAKTYSSWKRVRDLADRLWVDSGASTPHLRNLISCLGTLSSEQVSVPLAGGGDRVVRLQVLEEAGVGAEVEPFPAP
ncbi:MULTISPECIES: hypothetical protein [unclassified Limnothrix]|uniref:hypothetical protein n=1 Tax=Limnothrix sp. FACHB-1088 TaxID=2692816 RepID=UPI001F554E42|nr:MULTISPECIES: hypothetical protein [unclassified Limnothrix]